MEDKYKLNRQLEQKYQKNTNFRKMMQDREQIYKNAKNGLLKKQDLEIKEQILQIFTFDQQHEVFFYYGFLQPNGKSWSKKLALFMIKNFHPNLNKKYKLVFFNNLVQSTQIYYEFKNIFLTLPINFYFSLDQFIFVKPNWSQKFRQWWAIDDIEKFFRAKTRLINSIVDICPLLDTNVQKLTQILPNPIVQEQFPQIERKVMNKKETDFRLNLKGQQRSEQEKNQFGNFIENVMNYFNKSNKQPLSLDEYESNEADLPVILDELFDYFQEKPQKIKEEGLFRKSVSIDEQTEVLQKLMRGNFKCLQEIQNSHIIASLIKRFFAKLKTPIFPFTSFNRLMHDQGISDKLKLIKQQTQLLPQKNFICLMFLFQFLVQKVIPLQKFTKMDSRNIAICFSPCLLWSEKPSQLDLIYATKSSQIVKQILDNFEQVFGTEAERKQKVRSSVRMSREKWQNELTQEIKNLNQNEMKIGKLSIEN